MVYSIYILEKDKYLYDLIYYKLNNSFPEAYIRNIRYTSERIEADEFSAFTGILYDNFQFTAEDEIIKNAKNISFVMPLFELDTNNKPIPLNCKRIQDKLAELNTERITTTKGIKLFLPFVSIDDREKFILDYLSAKNFHNKMCLRLDFMSKLRFSYEKQLEESDGQMTRLLKAVKRSTFKSQSILDYCVPDRDCFISPGSTEGADDIFDFGLDTQLKLLEETRKLLDDCDLLHSSLVVAEGFRIRELSQFAALSSSLTILLQSKNKIETRRIEESLSEVIKALPPDSNTSIFYFDELYKESYYEY